MWINLLTNILICGQLWSEYKKLLAYYNHKQRHARSYQKNARFPYKQTFHLPSHMEILYNIQKSDSERALG